MRLMPSLKDFARRRLLNRAGIGVETERPVWLAGARSGVWAVDPTRLSADSVVYSFGVGDNVAWDVAMIEHFGCAVHAFDPTPRAIDWLARQSLPPRLVFEPVGLAAVDGEVAFAAPRTARDVNYRPLAADGEGTSAPAALRAPVRRLATIARTHGHTYLDVLKVDIEGGEYAVLADWLQTGPPVGQLLVEFHHGQDGVPFAATQRALRDLHTAGYRIFHVSRRGLEFSLLGSPPPAA